MVTFEVNIILMYFYHTYWVFKISLVYTYSKVHFKGYFSWNPKWSFSSRWGGLQQKEVVWLLTLKSQWSEFEFLPSHLVSVYLWGVTHKLSRLHPQKNVYLKKNMTWNVNIQTKYQEMCILPLAILFISNVTVSKALLCFIYCICKIHFIKIQCLITVWNRYEEQVIYKY